MRRTPLKRGTSQLKRSPLRKVSPKKVKKVKVKTLKAKLDSLFSQYIRRKYANEKGEVKCFTCPKVAPWKEMQCGHFVSRVYLAVRFEESNVRVQCVGCNVFGGGKTAIFATLLENYEPGITTKLYRKAQEITKDYPYEAQIAYYEEKLKEMM